MSILTLSFCVGNFVAFSPYPFPFGHTGLAILLSWLFKLRTSIVLLVAFLINNPWTAVPVYGADYLFGYWILHVLLGAHPANPAWMESVNNTFFCKLGMGNFCLWSFLLGGNLLALLSSVMLYPLMNYIFYSISKRNH